MAIREAVRRVTVPFRIETLDEAKSFLDSAPRDQGVVLFCKLGLAITFLVDGDVIEREGIEEFLSYISELSSEYFVAHSDLYGFVAPHSVFDDKSMSLSRQHKVMVTDWAKTFVQTTTTSGATKSLTLDKPFLPNPLKIGESR